MSTAVPPYQRPLRILLSTIPLPAHPRTALVVDLFLLRIPHSCPSLLGLHLDSRDFRYVPDNDIVPFNGRTLRIEAVFISANPFDGSMTMDWTILGEEKSLCDLQNLSACTDVNIFFDEYVREVTISVLLDSSAFCSSLLVNNNIGLRTIDPPTAPIFRFNATALAVRDILANSPTFRVFLALFSPGNGHSNLLYYPFDVYVKIECGNGLFDHYHRYPSEILVFAQDAVTNNTIGLNLAITRGIAVLVYVLFSPGALTLNA